jgi:hypothetical protein
MQGLHKTHLRMIGGCTMFSMLYCYTLHIAFFSSSATGMTNPNEEHIFRCVKNQQQVFIWSIVSVQFLVNKL